MSIDEFTELTERFVAFLKANKVTISPSVKVADFRSQDQGRAVIAIEDIKVDETLFELPQAVLLNYTTSELFDKFSEAEKKQVLESDSQWEILILCMFYEMVVRKSDSRWKAYFNVLPEKFNNLIFWSDSELKQLLPSLIVKRVGKEESESMYKRLTEERLEVYGLQSYKEQFTLALFHRIASIIHSYSFDVDSTFYNNSDEDEEDEIEDDYSSVKSMVCLADTLNADTKLVNANLIHDEGKLVMKATKPIKKGGQIYNTYGDHPNAELLRRYGYVEWNESKYDFGEVPFQAIIESFHKTYGVEESIVEEAVSLAATAGDFADHDDTIVAEEYECFIDGTVSPEFIFVIQLLTTIFEIDTKPAYSYDYSSLDENGKAKFLSRASKKLLQLINSNRITAAAKDNFQKVLQARLSQYPASLVKDSTPSEGNYNSRHDLGVAVLKSEINALKKCEDFFSTKSFTVVEDEKLIRNVLKKYEETGKKRTVQSKGKPNKKIKN